ncbi:uncharacterized protein BJX67DRAFT_133840 [Aspergillus lucknowensis]|uniref:Transmembrane protein n=1 Tax=Aspergillus lucknowensis TaxID=176173 RepID=A0ABR4LQ05_9EURO
MRTVPRISLPLSLSILNTSCFTSTGRIGRQLHGPANCLLSTHPQTTSTSFSSVRQFYHFPVLMSNSNSPFRLSTTQPTPPSEPTEQPEPEELREGAYYSPYKPKRTWPPDMSKLSPKHQFRLERKYRRRAALKYARPKWTKATKLVQWGGIGFVLLYALLFMEWDEKGGTPVEELRKYVFAAVKEAFSAPPSPASMRRPHDPVRE